MDKKKMEEELKKKAEEEAKKKAEEASKEKPLSEEEKAELLRQKEESLRIKRELEYFDFRTIHKFKENLGYYGDIYVNDAPLMSLSGSNSVAEIKCKKKVMGMRMTEEIRKIAMFFLKKHPLEINN
jgi:3-phosphoglycerate kinase